MERSSALIVFIDFRILAGEEDGGHRIACGEAH